jgi:hypothetical protein
MSHDLEELMRCEQMQRIPAAFKPRLPCAAPHDEETIRSEQAPRFPQEPNRIPETVHAVKKHYVFEDPGAETRTG